MARDLRDVRILAGFVAILATLATLAGWGGALDRTFTIPPEKVLLRQQASYAVALNDLITPLFLSPLYSGDTNGWPTISTLRLHEGGLALRPAHSIHIDIERQGGGRYSHWGNQLIFSASDNMDPRYNGRVYEIVYSPNLLVLYGFLIIAALSIGLSACLFVQSKPYAQSAFRRFCRNVYRLAQKPVFIWSQRAAAVSVILIAFSLELYISYYFGLTGLDGDGWVYARIADQLTRVRDWTVLPIVSATTANICSYGDTLVSCPSDVLEWRDIYGFLFRMPGYPAIIAFFKWASSENWQSAVVVLQHFLALAAACILYRTAARISGYRAIGIISAVLFLLSHRLQYDRAILTDSLCTSGLAILLCWVMINYNRRNLPSCLAFLLAGISFVGLFLLRETGALMAAAALPLFAMLAWQTRQVKECFARLAALYGPLCMTLLLMLSWSYARTGHFFVTTQSLSASLYTATQLERRGIPVFVGNTILDEVARKTLINHTFAEDMAINKRLLLEYNLNGPEQAYIMQSKYFEIWYQFPWQMVQFMRDNIAREWKNIFIISELIDLVPELYNAYCAWMVRWAWFCGVVVPILLLGAGLFTRTMRRSLFAALGLWSFWAVPTLAYSAFDIELRYLIFGTAPALLIFALSGRLLNWYLALIRGMLAGSSKQHAEPACRTIDTASDNHQSVIIQQ